MDGLSINLLNVIFSFLNCREIAILSMTNKHMNLATKSKCNDSWKKECNSYFCSTYEANRILDIDSFDENLFNTESNKKTQNFSRKKKNTLNWKQIFQAGIEVKKKWILLTDQLTGKIKDDVVEMNATLYNFLKKCSPSLKLRKKNPYIENSINSALQIALYDVINGEEELEEFSREVNSNRSLLNEIPLGLIMENYQNLINQFSSNNEMLKNFLQLRWYYSPDQMTFTNDNIISFLLKLIHSSLKHYCIMSYNYLYENYNLNDEEFLQEYFVRYKNYVETATEFNEKYKFLNLIINNLYQNFSQYNFPKFSFLRMFMVIWNNECTAKLFNNVSDRVANLFEKVLENGLNSIISINENSTWTRSCVGNDANKSLLLNSTSCTSSLSNSFNMFYSISLGFPSPKINEDGVTKEVISSVISCINDSFCNEYSIFQINLTTIETNEYYETIESSMNEIMKRQIFTYYHSRKKATTRKVFDDIMSFFSNSEFFNSKFIEKMKLSLFTTVYRVLEEILLDEISGVFTQRCKMIKNIPEETVSELTFSAEMENVYNRLIAELSSAEIGMKIKNYIANVFIEEYEKENNNLISLMNIVRMWFTKIKEKMIEKNRKVSKKLAKSKSLFSFDNEKKVILSFTWKPNIDDVLRAEQNKDIVM